VPVPALTAADKMTVDYGTRTLRPLAVSERVAQALQQRQSSPPVVKASAPAPAPERTEPAKSETRVVYRVRRGDTLSEIAAKYGVGVSSLKRWNKLRGSRIRTGQRLTIYTSDDGPTTAEASPKKSAPKKITYKVRRGDTLSEIAVRHGVSITKLRQWNNLRGSRIRVGQRLTIYPGNVGETTHLVRRGDTLVEIAKRYGVSVTDLKKWNGLRSSMIRPGQELTIRI